MGRTLTTTDAYAIINAIADEAFGKNNSIQAVDTSTFVSVGESLLATGTENVLNKISLVVGKTLAAARPYNAKLGLINAIDTDQYTHRFRKISYYARPAIIDGANNTDLKTNLANGYDNGSNSGNSTASMWEQHAPKVAEFNFGGSSEWQYCITTYENQLKVAFSSEADFLEFWRGRLTEAANDMESEREAFRRMTLLNYVAGLYDMDTTNGCVIDFTTRFNAKYGTSYTGAQLRTTYAEEFLKFFVAEVKKISKEFENRDVKYHWPVTDASGDVILRHTPMANQKLILLDEFWVDAEANVKSAIFNPEYLNIGNFETIDYWQSINDKPAISVTPAIPDTSDPTEQTAGNAVALDYVLGVLFDSDAILTDMQFDSAYSTPIEARKHYSNTWYTFAKNAINDFTEKGVIFVMS